MLIKKAVHCWAAFCLALVLGADREKWIGMVKESTSASGPDSSERGAPLNDRRGGKREEVIRNR